MIDAFVPPGAATAQADGTWMPIGTVSFLMGCSVGYAAPRLVSTGPARVRNFPSPYPSASDEAPRQNVTVEAFAIMANEVTVAVLRAAAFRTARTLPGQPATTTRDRQPVVNIT